MEAKGISGVIPNEERIDLHVTLFACADRIKMLSSTFDRK
jgi:hypothetical protein